MTQPLFMTLPFKMEREPPPFEGQDIKYPESLVRYFLNAYTRPGDKVFDPFAGLGTTLFVAEELGRIPYGIENEPSRREWVAGQLEHWTHLIEGDSGELAGYGFPKMDFAMTSPPFMAKNHKWNPLYAGDPDYQGYEVYLRQMQVIFKQLAALMKRGAHIVIQADNLPGRTYTPLVRDLAIAMNAADAAMRLDAEVIIAWEGGREDYRHTHCLVFKKP